MSAYFVFASALSLTGSLFVLIPSTYKSWRYHDRANVHFVRYEQLVADFPAANNAGDGGFGGGDVLFDDALACVAAAFCPRVFFRRAASR